MKNKTYKIYTLGCKVNQYDSGALAKGLEDRGLIGSTKDADFAIINTCAVTRTAISKCRYTVNKAKKDNPNASIAVIGCWPKIYKEEVEKLGVDLIYGTNEINTLIARLGFAETKNIACGVIDQNEKSRYFLKVQDGCDQYCTYCIIPYTRGKLKSRTKDDILLETKSAIDNGYNEIVLTGIHLGKWGYDLAGNMTLEDLVKEILKMEWKGRLRLSSIEITEITPKLLEIMSTEKRFCRHLHIPLQSGCDKILSKMNRPYGKSLFATKIKEIRKKIPDIAITTDIIVGFPGETDQDFRETVDFAEKIGFSRLHVFPFSKHSKAPASKFEGQLEKDIKSKRAETLRMVSINLEAEYIKKFRGKKLEVIIEGEKNGLIRLKTQFYFDIFIPKKEFKGKKINPGTIIDQICT